MDRPIAHSRVIQIAFQQHEDEPEANLLFAEMANCRDNVSKSLGELIRLSQRFEQPETKEHINHFICPPVARLLSQFGAPARFTTTMSIFMYRRIPRLRPPFVHARIGQKWGGGLYAGS